MGLLTPNKNTEEIDKLKTQIAELENKLDNKEKKEEELVPTEIYASWSAPSRVFVARDRAWFLKNAAVFLVIILLLAFLQEIVLIVVLVALLALIYVLSTVPPELATHEISNKGIKSFDKTYYWKNLKEFWLTNKQGFSVLNVTTDLRFPGRLVMIVDPSDEKNITEILLKRIPYMELPENKGQDWLSKRSDGIYKHKEEILFGEKKTS
jgi:hypothetical protein